MEAGLAKVARGISGITSPPEDRAAMNDQQCDARLEVESAHALHRLIR